MKTIHGSITAKADHIDKLLMGNGADYLFGGLTGLLSKDWTFEELVQRYTIIFDAIIAESIPPLNRIPVCSSNFSARISWMTHSISFAVATPFISFQRKIISIYPHVDLHGGVHSLQRDKRGAYGATCNSTETGRNVP